ncbi:DUF998 domain-containing protein [Dactylosporangium salmoneum]|uniref:DUF998 domain-containing protein n=1 Tax=Dactylosporangium salmoneum TaxID=53361 RepID=A0ABP5SFG7_9ACTN
MNLRYLALAGIAAAGALVIDGHLDPDGDLNPWSLTVSDFAVSDRGGVVDWAMVVMAAASVALLFALRRSGARVGAWVTALFGVWAAGLTVAALVPTDEPGLPLSAAGAVHRYASVAAFVALPVAGWLLGGRSVRVLAGLSLACALAMVYSAFPGDRVLIGLAERLLLAAEAALLVAVALAAPGARDRAARRRGAVSTVP